MLQFHRIAQRELIFWSPFKFIFHLVKNEIKQGMAWQHGATHPLKWLYQPKTWGTVEEMTMFQRSLRLSHFSQSTTVHRYNEFLQGRLLCTWIMTRTLQKLSFYKYCTCFQRRKILLFFEVNITSLLLTVWARCEFMIFIWRNVLYSCEAI